MSEFQPPGQFQPTERVQPTEQFQPPERFRSRKNFEPRNPDFEARLRAVFDGPGSLRSWGVDLLAVGPGWVGMMLDPSAVPVRPDGSPHPGMITAVLGDACEYAALSLSPAGSGIALVEYKVNFTRPTPGGALYVYGEVVRAGRTLTVCKASTFADDDPMRPAAYMLATFAAA